MRLADSIWRISKRMFGEIGTWLCVMCGNISWPAARHLAWPIMRWLSRKHRLAAQSNQSAFAAMLAAAACVRLRHRLASNLQKKKARNRNTDRGANSAGWRIHVARGWLMRRRLAVTACKQTWRSP